jgi:hypothetical protein
MEEKDKVIADKYVGAAAKSRCCRVIPRNHLNVTRSETAVVTQSKAQRVRRLPFLPQAASTLLAV